jgi:hypothetical protein
MVYAQTSHSPVGIWEVTISGRNHEQGIAFLTFSNDFTMGGYGMSFQSFGMFTIAGAWDLDARGSLVGSYTEQLGGQSFDGSFIGKATNGKRLIGKGVGSNGAFTLRGIPAAMTWDLTGNWIARVTERKVTVPEFISLTPSVFPSVFDFSGSGAGPSGAFLVSGTAIISSKGKLVVFGETDFASGGVGFSSLTGSFNVRRQTGSLGGMTDSGDRLTAKILQ